MLNADYLVIKILRKRFRVNNFLYYESISMKYRSRYAIQNLKAIK